MKKLLFLFALVCAPASLFAQTPLGLGMNYPFVQPEFFTSDGTKPCASCKLYSYAAGTTTPLATYTDVNLSIANTNPIVLDSTGRPSGGNGIFLLNQTYKFVLTASNGSTIWTRDNIAVLPGSGGGGGGGGGSAHPCTTGTDISAKIQAAYATLPASGGIIDCTNLTTAQSIGTSSGDPFVGMTVPTTVIMPIVLTTSLVPLNVPPNVTLLFPQGATLSNGSTTNIAGRIDAGNWQIFGGAGQVCFGISTVCNVVNGFQKTAIPQWWGAKGNGVILGGEQGPGTTGCNGSAGFNTLSCATGNFTSADVGKAYDLAHSGSSNCGQQYYGIGTSTFNCNQVGTITGVSSTTSVTLSQNLANSVTGEQFAYANSEGGFVASAINSGAAEIDMSGTYGVTSTILVTMKNQSMVAPGPQSGRILAIGPIAYGVNKAQTFVLLNGSQNDLFQNVSFIGTNELGELNTFGAAPDMFFICTGQAATAGCGPNGQIDNIRFVGCEFDYSWGIGFHNIGSGSTVGQQVTNIQISDSVAKYNSYDGINFNFWDGTFVKGVTSIYNGTGGLEVATDGSMVIQGGYYRFNKFGGVAMGGFNDTVNHLTTCTLTGADISENGNGYTTSTVGVGVTLSNGFNNCTVTGNTIRHNHLFGIQATTWSTSKNVTISGNTIVANGLLNASQLTAGIVAESNNMLISGNTITDEALATISSIQRTSNVVTVKLNAAYLVKVGYSVQVFGTSGGALDGTYTVLAVTDGQTFTATSVGANSGPFTGVAYTTAFGFVQDIGINLGNNISNVSIIHNQNYNNVLDNLYANGYTGLANIVYAIDTQLAATYVAPWATFFDINLGSTLPTKTGLYIVMPDIPTTAANVCTTAAAAAATCTTGVTHNIAANTNGAGSQVQATRCELDNAPNAQSGKPLLLMSNPNTQNAATITIGTLDGNAAGNGTMRCLSNFAY